MSAAEAFAVGTMTRSLDVAANASSFFGIRFRPGRVRVSRGRITETFARVARFRRALALARSGPARWAELAAEIGYFDQSHLVAEFREFAGDTPVPFFLSRSE